MLQNARVDGQQSLLKPSYAKQRAAAAGPVPAAVEVYPTANLTRYPVACLSCEHAVM